jgi:Protein of unknown function (DUF1759)
MAANAAILKRVNLKVFKEQFNGNYQEWATFKHKFEGLVTKNDALPEEHKLHYLRMVFTEDAADIQSENDTFESLWVHSRSTVHFNSTRNKMLDFLHRRCHTLEAIENVSEPKAKTKTSVTASNPTRATKSNTRVSQSNRKGSLLPIL